MAVRFTPSGLQSYDPQTYDPVREFKKKFVKKERVSEEEEPKKSKAPPVFAVYKNPKTGQPEFHGPGSKEAREWQKMLVTEQEAEKIAGVEREQRMEKFGGVIEEIGRVPKLTREQLEKELEDLNIPANIKSAMAGAGAEIVAGTGAGAVGGAVVGGVAGGGIGVVPGAVIGAIGGAGAIVLRNIKAESKEDTTAIGKKFKVIRTNMRLLISEVNAGRMTPDFAVNRYNYQVAEMNRLERQLKELTSTNLKDFLSDGSDQYAHVRAWQDIERPNMEAALQGAIVRPDPTKALTEDQIAEIIDMEDLE